ncbi:aspartate aminotransferase family protein [Winogradskyella sp. KYW1333]|uniref:aspartate aminotransferase family protein n=1 Tax=Winogradskyella sp. KYW1333 TaxID=2282123 RepID=UPI000DF1D7A0|nr:aspartate aminotransferase family protein [Winogradskyella sp. KYW1333]RCT55192.1 aspartate aminotransferase family protein [Winogradskyella sp. KYW1333]
MQVSDFFKYQAQTTPHPLAMEIKYAKGSYIYDSDDNPHLDFVAGVSACTLGHSHPAVVNAVKEQLDKYLHVMVYGEYIQQPAVDLCKKMAELLPEPLDTTYLVNSGTEAIEGSIKLARRYTGRSEIIAAKNSYHGNTLGSLSLMDYQERKRPFLPLLPGIRHITFNCEWCLEQITDKTAGVILETIQGGAGFIEPIEGYLSSVQKRCNEVGAVLILDEIQPGIGRTGKMFGFENYNCKPDIVVTGKGLGGGLPIGAFTASYEMMKHLTDNPKLGHITTFGGNPVIASAALSTLMELTNSNHIAETLEKEKLIREHLSHPLIKEIRGRGLMLAAITENAEITNEVILKCKEKGLILFWLLFESKAIRITPPLTISNEEIVKGCQIICSVLNTIQN